jgi:outer membrane immunogenic protein
LQGADISGSANVTGPFNVVGAGPVSGPASYTASEKLSWLGTTRGRLGLAFDRLLIYGTGGVAYGNTSVNQNLSFPVTQASSVSAL